MLVSVFKSNHRIVSLFVFALTALVSAPFFQLEKVNLLFSYAILDYLFLVALVCFQAIYFNRIINREKLIDNNTYLTSLFIVVINGGAFILIHLSEVIIANTFVVLSLFQLFKVYNEKYKMAQVFNAAVLMGIATVIYHPYVVYFPLIFFLIFYLTTPIWRDIAVLIMGFGLPFLYVLVYKFISDGFEALTIDLFFDLNFGVGIGPLSTASKVFLILLVAYCLLGALSFVKAITGGVVKVRKLLWSIVIVALFGWMTLFVNGGDLIELLVALSLPLAVLLAIYFQQLKYKWMAEIMFLLLLISLGWIYFS